MKCSFCKNKTKDKVEAYCTNCYNDIHVNGHKWGKLSAIKESSKKIRMHFCRDQAALFCKTQNNKYEDYCKHCYEIKELFGEVLSEARLFGIFLIIVGVLLL